MLLEENYWIQVTHIPSAALFVWLILAVFLRARRSPLVYSYLAFQGSFLLWLLAKLAASATINPSLKWWLVVVQYVGFCCLTPGLLAFALIRPTGRRPPLGFFVPAVVPSLLFLAAVATNPLHGWFFASWDVYAFTPGPLFYPHRLYEYGLGVVAAVLWARGYFREERGQPGMLWLFGGAILVPLAANVVSLHRGLVHFDLTPVGFSLSIALFSVAIFRRQFLDIIPVARRAALRHSPEALLLFDGSGRPLAWNERMQEALGAGRLQSPTPRRPLEAYLGAACAAATRAPGVAGLPRLPASARTADRGPELVLQNAQKEHWRMALVPVEAWARRGAVVLRAIDVTAQVRLGEELAERMQDLRRAGEALRREAAMARQIAQMRTRNALARDVHDILGHSLVVVISLLEVARLSPAQAGPALGTATRILEGCWKDLRTAPGTPAGPATGLAALLEAAAAEVRRAGVEVELIVQGRPAGLDHARTEALAGVCREAITNALRHGAATRIGIAVRYNVSGCELYVENNGRGAPVITKGFGLSGIEARLAKLGGEARFLSDGVSGFLVRAFVPYADEVREARS